MDWPVPVSMARVFMRVRTDSRTMWGMRRKTISSFCDIFGPRGEEVFEERNFAEAGGAVDVEAVLLGDDAGEEAGLAVLELDDLIGGALTDDGLGDAGDGDACRPARRPRS